MEAFNIQYQFGMLARKRYTSNVQRDIWKNKWVKIGILSTEGGHGRTYYARPSGSLDMSPTHVLKELKNQSDSDRRTRMSQEVANLRVLEHPGVAMYADSNAQDYKEDVELYLVTQLIPGKTLRQFVDRKPLDVDNALSISLRLLEILEHCHSKNVVHRDIKPDNIIVRGNDPKDPALIDFGLSFNSDTQPKDFATPGSQEIGSRFYHLPEFRTTEGYKRDPISDVTLVAAILFYCTTALDPDVPADDHGFAPHRRPMAASHLQTVHGAKQAQLNRIFDGAFQPERVKRWQSVESLRREIEAVRAVETSTPRPFGELLSDFQKRFNETPQHVISAQIHLLKKHFEMTAQQVYSETASSVKENFNPQIALFSKPLNGVSSSRTFFFLYKFDPQKQVKVTLYAMIDGGEFLVGGAVDGNLNTPELRMGLFDPRGESLIRQAIERHFVKCFESTII